MSLRSGSKCLFHFVGTLVSKGFTDVFRTALHLEIYQQTDKADCLSAVRITCELNKWPQWQRDKNKTATFDVLFLTTCFKKMVFTVLSVGSIFPLTYSEIIFLIAFAFKHTNDILANLKKSVICINVQ